MQKQLPGNFVFGETDTARFMRKFDVVLDGGCWEWRSVSSRGRGVFTAQRGRVLAPRASWMIFRGPIPEGMHVLHTCDNPRCVNPGHLFIGTHDDNMADKAAKGRAHRMPGERHPLAKITDETAKEIYRSVAACGESSVEVAKRYGVHYDTVRKIVTGRQWSSVTGAHKE